MANLQELPTGTSVVSFAEPEKQNSIHFPDIWPRGSVPASWENVASPEAVCLFCAAIKPPQN